MSGTDAAGAGQTDEDLAAAWGSAIDAETDGLVPVQPARILNQAEIDSLLGFDDGPVPGENLMVVDSTLIYSLVDVLLGGRRGTAAMRIEGRPYTTIERTLVERMIHVVLADLSVSFDPLCPVTFRFERLEVNPRFATISRLSNAAVLARLRIDMEDRGGQLEMLLPYATLEPIRELLLQQFMGEKFGRDSIWETHLAEELWNTEIDLDVVLDELTMRLSDVMALQPGSRIVLNTHVSAAVELRCGGTKLFEARIGKRKNRMAVRIEREVQRLTVFDR